MNLIKNAFYNKRNLLTIVIFLGALTLNEETALMITLISLVFCIYKFAGEDIQKIFEAARITIKQNLQFDSTILSLLKNKGINYIKNSKLGIALIGVNKDIKSDSAIELQSQNINLLAMSDFDSGPLLAFMDDFYDIIIDMILSDLDIPEEEPIFNFKDFLEYNR